MSIDEEVKWEKRFLAYFHEGKFKQDDAAHDLEHFKRVYKTAKQIAESERDSFDPLILVAAAFLHDIINLPKNHLDSKNSSRLSAVKAKEILEEMKFPQEKISPVCHAIEAHSFSAQIAPVTIEAKIIQDADRMESLGTLGIMRTFYVCGRLGLTTYDPHDILAENRELNDKKFGLDHFYCKLFKLPSLLQTIGGRKIAEKRIHFLQHYVDELMEDIPKQSGPALTILKACYEGGKNHMKLFHPTNPFAQNRPLEPVNFVVDHLLELQKNTPSPFMGHFLTQFHQEVA